MTPSAINQQLRGFGSSISAEVDVDGNGMPDLAVGASDTGKAVILRSRQVVRINPRSYYLLPTKAVDPKENGKLLWYKRGVPPNPSMQECCLLCPGKSLAPV